MAGDYFHWQAVYTRKVVDFDKTVLTMNVPGLVTVKSPNHYLVIQKIIYSPGVYAVDPITFSDSVTGQQIAFFSVPATAPALPGLMEYLVDYGLTGTALAQGANLNLSNGGVSIGRVHIEAYERLGNAVAFVSGNEHPISNPPSTPSYQM